ncbi:hypothetical protein DFQ28_005268 [Apophysomyces sp. BC1034]|nr:hypothetical protein DFQ30_003433 [Apophysomyces sp. BC1015]KAG0182806.1 hypothetical protein DFQ29_001971 [Apophysomyces sp. BC1021]KAG0193450.1 hypothetical protein DFQ28_005268 [Apophysomyces sp. BC1034]
MTDSGYSHVSFSKDLPQSSLLLHSPIIRSLSEFKHAPRTLFDEMGPLDRLSDTSESDPYDTDVDWQVLVRRLQKENASLVSSLRGAQADLHRCRLEKSELEDIYARQADASDAIILRLRNALCRQIQEKKEDRANQRALEARLRESELDRQMLRTLQHPYPTTLVDKTSRQQLQTLQSELDQVAARRSELLTSIRTTQDQVDQLEVRAEHNEIAQLVGSHRVERRNTTSTEMWQQALWTAQQQAQRESQMRMDLGKSLRTH